MAGVDAANRCPVSRAGIASGIKREGDVWYDLDTFLIDQIEEVLNKLAEGAIDDEIWAKVVIMEKCKRVAKAYVRHPTLIVDGSEEEFDGKTIGFNHFANPDRDQQTAEIRQKIKEGVILKMDVHGNVKGMARGAAPVICQAWKDTKQNCVGERLIRAQGKLHGEHKAYKLFDMRRWKAAVERVAEGDGETRTLLPRACIRVALARDGGGEMARTPCWIAVVNLVALDVLLARIPAAASHGGQVAVSSLAESSCVAVRAAPSRESAPPSVAALTAEQQIPVIVAAAVAQMNEKLTSQLLKAEQLSQLANALAISKKAATVQPKSSPTRPTKKERRRIGLKKSCDDLLESSEDSALRSESSSSREKEEEASNDEWDSSVKSVDVLYGVQPPQETKETKSSRSGGFMNGGRQRLQDLFAPKKAPVTSDYESTRETFDSSSCSSTVSHNFKDYKGISEMTKKLSTKQLGEEIVEKAVLTRRLGGRGPSTAVDQGTSSAVPREPTSVVPRGVSSGPRSAPSGVPSRPMPTLNWNCVRPEEHELHRLPRVAALPRTPRAFPPEEAKEQSGRSGRREKSGERAFTLERRREKSGERAFTLERRREKSGERAFTLERNRQSSLGWRPGESATLERRVASACPSASSAASGAEWRRLGSRPLPPVQQQQQRLLRRRSSRSSSATLPPSSQPRPLPSLTRQENSSPRLPAPFTRLMNKLAMSRH